MLWKVNYVVDNGYDWENRVCIIKADKKEFVEEILHTDIELNLPRESFILNKYTEITEIGECNNDGVLFDGSR